MIHDIALLQHLIEHFFPVITRSLKLPLVSLHRAQSILLTFEPTKQAVMKVSNESEDQVTSEWHGVAQGATLQPQLINVHTYIFTPLATII